MAEMMTWHPPVGEARAVHCSPLPTARIVGGLATRRKALAGLSDRHSRMGAGRGEHDTATPLPRGGRQQHAGRPACPPLGGWTLSMSSTRGNPGEQKERRVNEDLFTMCENVQ